MPSDSWKQRLIDEHSDLSKKIDSLEYLLMCWDNDGMSIRPKTPRNLFDKQLQVMKEYQMCLEARLLIEGIYGN